jgi:hypothetical protein
MIPAFTPDGLLPPGVHQATWGEVVTRFGTNKHRKRLLKGLELALRHLRIAGCRRAYIDGSFVTQKERPGDYDVCYDPSGMDPMLLDPVFFDFSANRAGQRAKYLGEFFPAFNPAAAGYNYFQFFQQDSESGTDKGIVAIDPRSDS